MSCGHDHCTCDHDTETTDTGHGRHLPTVNDEAAPERASGCCGGHRHGGHRAPEPDSAR